MNELYRPGNQDDNLTDIVERALTALRSADVATGTAARLSTLPDGGDVLRLVSVHKEHPVGPEQAGPGLGAQGGQAPGPALTARALLSCVRVVRRGGAAHGGTEHWGVVELVTERRVLGRH